MGSIVCCVVNAAQFSGGYSSYPRVPGGNNKRGLGLQDLSDSQATSPISLKNIGSALRPLQNYFSAGIVFMALLKLVQDKGLLGPNLALAGFGRALKPKSDESPNKELKKDQEEIWNAILNIHNTQKISRDETEASTAAILKLRSEQESFAQQYKAKMDAVTSRLEEIDQSLLEISQSVTALTQSVDIRELREGLTEVEDRVERESRATAASVKQIREELPEMMQKHDSMVSEKLGKFKEDLKRILTSNKPNTGSGDSRADAKAISGNKSTTKSSNKKK
eukprot:Colp12_sorted_trinity150504_noHs@15316